MTWRGIFVGCLGALGIGLGAAYAVFVLRGSYMDLDFSTPGAVFLIFILVAGPNLLLRRFARRFSLTQAELLTVYVMMIVASAIPTMGLTGQVLPLASASYYYATPENKWEDVLIKNMPAWVAPRGSEVGGKTIADFFEGAGEGTPIPWDAWLPALGAWLPFLLCLHLVMICMMVILRRQWVDREKLAYPLVQLPIELTETKGASAACALLRDPAMWTGFAIPFAIGGLIGLHFYFPSVPRPRLDMSVPMFRQTSSLILRMSFPMLGFFYLVSAETTLSLWLFNLLFFAVRGILDVLGVGLQENLGPFGAVSPTFKHVGMGAMLSLVATGLWVARDQLKSVWLAAIGRGSPGEDTGEIISYRFAFWGTALGLVFMGVWLGYTGMPWYVVIHFLVLVFVLFIGLTRIVAESGMAEAVAAAIAPPMVVSQLGANAIGSRGIMGLALTYVWCSDIRTYVMASAANGLKITEKMPHGRRRLFWGMVLAILVAIASSMWITLKWGYEEGGQTMNSWFFTGSPMGCYTWAADKIINREGIKWAGLGLAAAGAVTMVILAVARQRIMWWPFHPIGFAIGGTWIMDQLWLTCFIAWLLKSMVLRYGGLKLYQRLRPAFLGLILGQFTCNGFWLIVDHFTGRTGNQIFWI